MIGAFDSTETNPQLFNSVDEAKAAFGTNGTTYAGCAVIDDLFVGAESLLAVNITTKSGTAPDETIDTTITTTNLAASLAKIKGEDFDILFVAATLTDAFLPIITTFLEETFEMKYPAGYVGCLAGATDAANVTSAGLAGEHCYGLITQRLRVGGTLLSILRSAAYYCGILAGMNVGNSMTMKIVPGVIGVSPELSFETGGSGKTLLEAGITTFKCQDRNDGRYIVVNSQQPNGYDLYVNRVRNFVVKQLSLHQFLGERNNTPTLNEIKQEIERVKAQCVDTLDLLEDINFSVNKKNASTVEIHIDSLLFAGIITEIDVYVRVELDEGDNDEEVE